MQESVSGASGVGIDGRRVVRAFLSHLDRWWLIKSSLVASDRSCATPQANDDEATSDIDQRPGPWFSAASYPAVRKLISLPDAQPACLLHALALACSTASPLHHHAPHDSLYHRRQCHCQKHPRAPRKRGQAEADGEPTVPAVVEDRAG